MTMSALSYSTFHSALQVNIDMRIRNRQLFQFLYDKLIHDRRTADDHPGVFADAGFAEKGGDDPYISLPVSIRLVYGLMVFNPLFFVSSIEPDNSGITDPLVCGHRKTG